MCTIPFKLEQAVFFHSAALPIAPLAGWAKLTPACQLYQQCNTVCLNILQDINTVSMPSTLLRMKTVAKTKTGLPFYVYFPCAKLVNKTRNLNCVDQRSRIIKCSIYMKGALMCAYKLHSNQKSPRSVFYGFLAKWTQMLMRTLRSGVM